MKRNSLYTPALIIILSIITTQGNALAAPPAVQGPESVDDWWNNGQQFIKDSKRSYLKHHLQLKSHAKNIILFVGDGMGISTVTAARILEGQLRRKMGEENLLSFEKFPYAALSKTYSWDQQTSDSAPTMTAMVTGYKARESMLSVNHTTARYEGDANNIIKTSLKTILEHAADIGKDTGIVTTARVTHATPAANYAHTAVRDWESDANIRQYEFENNLTPNSITVKDIALQLVEASTPVRKSLKVVMGGGQSPFLPRTSDNNDSNSDQRKDGRNLIDEWVASRGENTVYVSNKEQFDAVNPKQTSHLLGLFGKSHMQYESDRDKSSSGEPSLSEMTEKAIQILSKNKKGFYLQIEGGRIDHAHHDGIAYRALRETIEFSNAVKKALTMTNPNDTLIIVTADHSHTLSIGGYPHRGNPILGLVKDVPKKDGATVELSRDKLGLPYTTLSYQNGPGWRGSLPVNGANRPQLNQTDSEARDFIQEATVPLSAETHGGEDVPIYASGPKAYLIHGVMEQNWIYHVMKEAF